MVCDKCTRDFQWTRAGKLIEVSTDQKVYTVVHENDAGDEEILVGFTSNAVNIVDGYLHDGAMQWFKCVECFVRDNPTKVLDDASRRSAKAVSAMREAQRDEVTLQEIAQKFKLGRFA